MIFRIWNCILQSINQSIFRMNCESNQQKPCRLSLRNYLYVPFLWTGFIQSSPPHHHLLPPQLKPSSPQPSSIPSLYLFRRSIFSYIQFMHSFGYSTLQNENETKKMNNSKMKSSNRNEFKPNSSVFIIFLVFVYFVYVH